MALVSLPPGHDVHCMGCGRPVAECPGCARPLDPPRFCPGCGRRLRVVVTPAGWTARCRDHGEVTAQT